MKKVPLRIRHQVIVDSTCVPANITCPTDSKLLSTVWKNLTGSLQKIRATGVSLVIRGKRKTASLIRSFNLKRRKTRKEITKMNRRLIRMGKKMMNKVQETLKEHGKQICAKFRKNVRKIIRTAKEILRQQDQMIQSQTRRMKDRIVSFHEPLRMYRQRAARGEGLIGVFKNRYQGHRNRYRHKNAQAWISFAMIAMNGTWAAKQSLAT